MLQSFYEVFNVIKFKETFYNVRKGVEVFNKVMKKIHRHWFSCLKPTIRLKEYFILWCNLLAEPILNFTKLFLQDLFDQKVQKISKPGNTNIVIVKKSNLNSRKIFIMENLVALFKSFLFFVASYQHFFSHFSSKIKVFKDILWKFRLV